MSRSRRAGVTVTARLAPRKMRTSLYNVAKRHRSTWLPSSARRWLEDIENAGYTRALTDRMKTVPALAGREESIAADIVSRTKELIDDELATRADTVVSDSERTHIKTAARALASYEMLRPFLGNDETTLETIRSHHGAETTATSLNGGLVRGALMLSANKVKTVASMVGNVTNDLAPGRWTRTDSEDGGATFTTATCTYKEFFARRDAEFLLETTCCSLDIDLWFGNVDPSVCKVELERSMARDGDENCRVAVHAGSRE